MANAQSNPTDSIEKIPEGKCYICKHGGNKRYNYGFCSLMALYCRENKQLLSDMKVCPLQVK